MSLGTSNRDGGKTSESGHLRALGKVVNGDVIEGLAVSQRAAGANMSVDVAVGDAFVRRSDGSYAHPVFNDAVYNQNITTADGSNPRRDILVLYVDYGQAPSTAVSNNTNGVVKIKMVNGLAAGSPVDPSDSAIQSSVGAGNPWIKLARVRVPAGQTSISNTLIDDLRTMISNKNNTVNTLALVDNAITAAKIGAGAVTFSKLDLSTFLKPKMAIGSNASLAQPGTFISTTYDFVAGITYLLMWNVQQRSYNNTGSVWQWDIQTSNITRSTSRSEGNGQNPQPIIGLYTPSTTATETVRVVGSRLTGGAAVDIEVPRLMIIPILSTP